MRSFIVFAILVSIAIAYKLVSTKKKARARRPHSATDTARTPTTTPKFWEVHKDGWAKQHWTREDATVLPLIVVVLLIHLGLYTLFPVFWTEWSESTGFWFMQFLLFAGFYMKARKADMLRLGGSVLVTLAVLGLASGAWDALKATKLSISSIPLLPTQAQPAQAAPRTPEVRYIVAPVDKPSEERAELLHGGRIEPQGPIWVIDDNGKKYESGNDGEYPLPRMHHARFQSRPLKEGDPITDVKVKVTEFK